MTLRGDLIRQIRERVGLSQRETAKDTGLGEHAVHRMEKGEGDPGISKVVKLADYLDVSVDYLTGRTQDPKSHKGIDGVSAEDQEFLAALHRRDYRTVFDMIGIKLDEYLDQKPGISGGAPSSNK